MLKIPEGSLSITLSNSTKSYHTKIKTFNYVFVNWYTKIIFKLLIEIMSLQNIIATVAKNIMNPSQYTTNEIVMAVWSFIWKPSDANKLSPYVSLVEDDKIIIDIRITYIVLMDFL